MVTRVSTVGNYAVVLANLTASQQHQLEAGIRVSTGKNGSNLKEFARSDELLTAARSVKTRLQGFAEQNTLIADKLTTQDAALNRVADSIQAIRQAITDALASGNATNLINEIQGQLSQAVGAINARYNGTYLFSGGAIDTQPLTAQQLSDLTAGPPVSSFFRNDQFKAKVQLDEASSVTTGVLAADIGTPLLNALKTIETFEEGSSGPLNGILTQAQRSFLEDQLATLDDVHAGVVSIAAQNGTVQRRVDGAKEDLTSRQNILDRMIGDITDADIAKASSDLQLANLSFQAAAQVFQTLKNTSLLSLLQIQ